MDEQPKGAAMRNRLRQCFVITLGILIVMTFGAASFSFAADAGTNTAGGGKSGSPAGAPAKDAPAAVTAIYLNGENGNDANDGATKSGAVKTFARARELAASNQKITTIYVTGTVQVSGDISLAGTKAMIKRDPDFSWYLMGVARGKTAVLKDITLDGNSENAKTTRDSLIFCGGNLTIEDGAVLQNNKLTNLSSYATAMGGAVRVEGPGSGPSASLTMTGGTIRNNSATLGGGVCLHWHADFTMSGGEITDNAAADCTGNREHIASGGGVCVTDYCSFTLTGGKISNNTSANNGGGISLGNAVMPYGMETLTMSGGDVTGNTAGASGGGIFIQAGTTEAYGSATISGGNISNNSMNGKGTGNKAFGGGGIYVNGYGQLQIGGYVMHNGELHLTNALITENSAEMQGGGYAACPSSDTKIYVRHGAAIYRNTAESAKDIYILSSLRYGYHSGSPSYDISPIMLGGTPYRWKDEDGSERELSRLKGTLQADQSEALSLHTDENPGAVSSARVTISNNTSATRGGGIGSNGFVEIGQSSETTKIDVTKTWKGGNSSKRPESIQVKLYCRVSGSAKSSVYMGKGTVRADADGNWRLTFENLPKTDPAGNAYVYSVKEAPVDGYTATISGNQEAGFTITNAPKKPRAHKKTHVREEKKPKHSKTTKPSKTSKTPKTGDETPVMSWLVLAMGTACALGLLTSLRRKVR